MDVLWKISNTRQSHEIIYPNKLCRASTVREEQCISTNNIRDQRVKEMSRDELRMHYDEIL